MSRKIVPYYSGLVAIDPKTSQPGINIVDLETIARNDKDPGWEA
jgi:hypothetical protein